jgi:hypothetical protein
VPDAVEQVFCNRCRTPYARPPRGKAGLVPYCPDCRAWLAHLERLALKRAFRRIKELERGREPRGGPEPGRAERVEGYAAAVAAGGTLFEGHQPREGRA